MWTAVIVVVGAGAYLAACVLCLAVIAATAEHDADGRMGD